MAFAVKCKIKGNSATTHRLRQVGYLYPLRKLVLRVYKEIGKLSIVALIGFFGFFLVQPCTITEFTVLCSRWS